MALGRSKLISAPSLFLFLLDDPWILNLLIPSTFNFVSSKVSLKICIKNINTNYFALLAHVGTLCYFKSCVLSLMTSLTGKRISKGSSLASTLYDFSPSSSVRSTSINSSKVVALTYVCDFTFFRGVSLGCSGKIHVLMKIKTIKWSLKKKNNYIF